MRLRPKRSTEPAVAASGWVPLFGLTLIQAHAILDLRLQKLTGMERLAVEKEHQELGAEIDNKSGSRIGVKLKGHSVSFHHANHSTPVDEVVQIRKFLIDCGIDPSQFPA